MKSDVKVSVIMNSKNVAPYIEKAIRSVTGQTLKDIEIICVDAFSTDGTREIIQSYMDKEERIKLVDDVKGSTGYSNNIGIQMAEGEYIGFVETDDYILPEMYEKQYTIAKRYDLDVVRGDYYLICDKNSMEDRFLIDIQSDVRLEKKVLNNDNGLFLSMGVNGYWNGIYRKDFLVGNDIKENETKGASYQDITFSFLTQLYAKRIWFMDEAFYCYRVDNPNASMLSANAIDRLSVEYRELQVRLVERGLWFGNKETFLSWEINSYRNMLRDMGDNVTNDTLRKVYMELHGQIEKEVFSESGIYDSVKNIYKALIAGEKEFCETIVDSRDTYEKKRTEEYFLRKLSVGSAVVLVGLGNIGRYVWEYLKEHDADIAFADNSIEKQHSGFMDCPVLSPHDAVERFPDRIYIVANIDHAYDIKDQLVGLGINEERIILCNDLWHFVRRIHMPVQG